MNLKNFPSKVTWIAEHRDGDKCYYYPGTGWVGSTDGLVRGFDDTDSQVVDAAPTDATHVQIVNGKVQHVRYLDPLSCVDIWRHSTWQTACTLSKLPGTVVRIADGNVFGSGGQPKAPTPVKWQTDQPEGMQLYNGKVYVEYAGGGYTEDFAANIDWKHVTRWRYAS